MNSLTHTHTVGLPACSPTHKPLLYQFCNKMTNQLCAEISPQPTHESGCLYTTHVRDRSCIKQHMHMLHDHEAYPDP